VQAGQPAEFKATVSNPSGVTYQWQIFDFYGGWTNITNNATYSGATTNNLQITSATDGMSGNTYRCVVTNEAGSVNSNSATLVVQTPPSAPVVVAHPVNRTVVEGGTATFTANATGNPVPTYQWEVSNGGSWSTINDDAYFSGTKTGTFTFTNATLVLDGYKFRCVITNSEGSVNTNEATLTVKSSAKAVAVGTQSGVISQGAGGSVTFPVTTENIAAGYQPASVSGLPGGMTASSTIAIGTYGKGTLTLYGTAAAPAGTYPLTLTINGATSATFNLTVSALGVISISEITGITAPVMGATPDGDFDNTDEFFSSVSSVTWKVSGTGGLYDFTGPFAADTAYEAQIILTQETGYSLAGIPANFFTVDGAQTTVHSAHTSGSSITIIAVFPPTGSSATAPVFTLHPVSPSAVEGDTITLTATATGATSYKWECNPGGGFVPLTDTTIFSGINTDTLTFTAALGLGGGWQYRCVATGTGSTASAWVTLDIEPSPIKHTVTVNINKDDAPWIGHGKTVDLHDNSTYTSAGYTGVVVNGSVVFSEVSNGTYFAVIDGSAYGADLVVNNANANNAIDYYTVYYSVLDDGTASGSTISATYSSSPISSGDVVLGGRPLSVTAVGDGADDYSYAWEGTASGTTNTYTRSTLAEAVNAVCVVTGLDAPTITSANSYSCETVSGGYFQLTATGTQPITWTLTGSPPPEVSISGDNLIVDPTIAFGTYNFTVNATNGTAPNATQAFTLTVEADTTLPFVYAVLPDGTGEDTSGDVVISFSEPMDNTTPGVVQLHDLTNTITLTGGTWNADKTVYTIPYSGLDDATYYTVAISTFEDAVGNIMEPSNYFMFRTASVPVQITFNANGGSVTPATAMTGIDGKLASLPTPTRSGYTFNGWFTAASGGTAVDTVYVFDTATTIFAQWTSTGGGGSSGGGITVNAINPATATFDKTTGTANNKDIVVTLTAVSGSSLSAIKNGSATLVEGTDYTKSGNTYTIKTSYLKTLATGTATLTFDMSSGADPALKVTITETDADGWVNPFIDVNADHWFYGDVKYAHQNGLFAGTSANTFSPNMPMTRGMVVTVLGRLAGIDVADYSGVSFDDVATSQWYAPYVKWAAEMGIVSGIGNNNYAPDANISRQDLAVILARYADKMGITMSQTLQSVAFADSSDIADYAVDAVATMVRAGIVSGKPGNVFDPAANATRAEVAAMLHRFCEAVK